ncbi:VCBS domain-containing protein [Pseudomonas sp. PDM08]|nr:VCBS domain-containing protein [Pseudomonas sp. PDM08]MBD9606181.1 type I secretion C-terminal target domain-containing protein [Pseudomonas sp. PDM08]
MATTTTTSGGTVTSFSNTPQAQDDIFTTGVIGTSNVTITEDLQGVVYLDVMSNDLGGNAKTLWSVDNATSLSTATKVYAPADLLVQDTSRIEATSTDTSLNGAKIWITSDGKVGYDAATLSTAFKTQLQELAAGASLADSFTYAIRLGNGTLSWATAQVQFAGMNDSVTMNVSVQAGTVTEDAPTTPSTTDSLSTTGTIAFSDVDLSDTHTASFVAAGGNTTALGNFSLASVIEAANAANGTVNWTYTVNNAAAQYLAQGQTATETYVVTVSDGHGSSTTQNVIITITGTNDQVHITSGVQTGDAKEDSGDYAANGSITFTDADLIDTHSVTVTPGASGYLGSFTTDPLHDSTGTGSGSLGWHFAVDNAAVQFLGEGQILTQTYNVAIGDGTVQTVTITITGTNDRPTLTIADTTGAMSEGNGTATLSDSGALSFADVDNIDVVTVSHASNGNIAWSGGTLDAGVASALVAGFSVDHNSWDYSTSQNLDFLGAGETVTFSYTVVATDNSGAANAASATQTVTITITGSNDAPVLSFANGNDAGAVKEDTTLSVSGQFSSTDIDHAATATWSIAGSNTGSYGSITVDGTGQWTYTLANGTDGVASAVQSLKVGESHNEVFSVQVSDGLGGVATHLVTVTVTGSNDAPVLSFASGNDVGAVQEDSTLSVSGQFSSTDIDHAATATWSIAGSNTGSYGSIAVDSSGQWTYTLANGTNGVASAVQSLKAGESHNEVFSVQVSDGLGGVDTQQVTVTVTGSNDAPVLSFANGNDAGAVQEDTTLSVSGQFSSSDIDHAATATWSIAGSNTGTYGSIAVDSSGQWTYTLANGTDGVASAVQSLQAGESHNEVFSVQVSDGLGGVATHLVTVTVTGSNDAPVLSFASGNDVGAVQEDTTLSVSGQFSSTDIDHAATATWSIAGSNTGSYGSIAVDSSGQWTYTLANGTDGVASAVQSLKAGESHNEVFSVQVSDGLGGVDTQQVTVTVTGSNDAPVLSFASGNDVGAVQEDSTLSVSGQFSSTDIDHAATATWSIAGSNTGSYGSIAVDSSGQWTYTLANGTDGVASAVQSLQAGESHNEVFTIQVSDGLGGVDTQQVTVTVTGSNDAPVLSFASGNDVGAVQEDSTLSVSGQFSSTDIDHAATATWSIAGSNTGSYGSIAVDSSGQWTYTLANGTDGVASAVQSLQAGESHDEVFTIQVSDGLGGVDTQQVTVTVTGSNDAPVLSFASGNDVGAVQEDTTLSVSGQFSSSDIDHAATATWSIAGSNTGTYGSIAVDSSGQWTYTLANGTDGVASAVQSLKAGESHNEVFSVQVSDGLGGVATHLVTVTVTGSNDAPVLSFASGNDVGAVQEDTTLSVSGQFSSTDIDHAATATWSIAGSNTGSYGSIAVDSSGQWTYTLANGTDGVASAVQSLKAGESHNEVFTIQVSDGLGGVDTQQVTVTVTGSNDAPVLSFASGNDVGAVQEDSSLSVSGQFSSSDIDHNATATWSINGSATGTYGSIAVDGSGQWTYTLANGTNGVASAVQSLQAGESHNEVFTIQVSDGLGGVDTQQVTVTVTGSNDAPVLSFASGNDAGAVQEDSTLSVSGQFSSTDIDHAATATWSIAGSNTGTYGSIAVDSSGQWTYTLANGTDGVASAVQSLQAGETHNEVFSVQVSDGLGGVDTQQVTVTVTGSNDAPVLSFASGNDVGAVQEDTTLSASGQFSSSDIDHAATATWSIAGSNTGSYGSIAVDGTGQWTYTLANGTDGVASAVQSLKAGETHNEVFSVQVSDGLGGVDTQQVTVTVTGSNDAPVLSFASGNDAGNVQEDTTLSVSGQFSSSDIDHAATATWSIAGSNTGTYGSIAVDSTGQWTYTLANGTNGVASAVQSLQAGESHNEVFTIQVSDGLGGVDTQQVTVTVTGSNDAAVLSSANVTLTETNAPLTTGGSLTVSDIDSPESFHTQTNTAGSYGQFSIGTDGAWTYVANSAHNEFAAGTTYTDTFAVSSADGTLTSVTVHILGTNDAAVLSTGIANLTETNAAVDISTAGTLTISDVDSAATFVAQTNTAGSYGQFSIGTGGAWTYVANSAHNEFAAGTTYTDTFAVSSADGTLTSVTVHILGTNDAAVLSTGIANLTETNAAVDISTAGTLTISDVDSAATFVAQTNTAGSYGQFSIGTDGAWTYVANSAHNEFAAGTTYTDTFAVSSADGTLTSVTVHIAGSNDSPTITSNGAGATASINVAENTTAVTTVAATDADLPAQTLTYSIVGGVDAAKFSIVSGTGVLSFVSAPNFEAPTDSGTNNVYDVIVRASDGTLFDDQAIAVTVTGVNDNSPIITSNGADATASVSVAENTTAVTTVAATDADLPTQTLTYSIVGGVDAAKFSIVSGTGVLSFVSAPNFEAPTDSGTNNVYDVIVRASDGTLFDDQAIAVTVTGVNDNSPIITSNGGGATASINVLENTTAVTTVVATDADLPAQTLSYSILSTAGTDFSKFSISSSGVLTFNSAPDYENPQDVGGTAGDNAYVVNVQVADGNGGIDTQTITVNVQNVVETPVDTVPPTVAVTGTALGSSVGSTSTVTFQFSETVSGFTLSDVAVTTTSGVPRGTFSNFTQVDGDTYTTILTRTQGGSIKVDVAANSYTDLAGNPGAAGSSANLPAGVAGDPINLALNVPLADISGPVTVSISGVPSGWVFNAGTDNGDGTWTVHTNDPGALTVTAPSDFVGALVLDVNMNWSNSDGSTASAYVFNNVEVYAPGAPIFALSANDNLTGSSGADTFVFAQPIGNNQIFNFDAAADKIDLVGFTGINGFADLSITNDANGNALVSISTGQTVTLKGIDAADLSEANFQFDVDPLTNNAVTLTIADGAIMPFGGSIHNSGTIELGSAGSATSLEVLFRGATLTGGGQVLLSDNAQNVIFGGSADTVLNNVDNRISGAGQLGAGQMVLINSGLIMASGLNSLVLDTGTHTITNSGVLESTGPGGMTVASTVENTGHLWANGGDLRLLADVTGDGSATIDGNATLTFSGAAHGSVAFHGEGAGTLVIAQAETAGSLAGILGLESNDMLTFGNLTFGANTQLSYNTNASGAGGLLTVDDGVHRAEVNLLGHYSAEDFQVTDGGAAGTQVSYHGESSGTLVGTMLADTINGGDGNDIIVGRGGADTLSGGAGADVFAYFNVNEGGDHILDYNYAEGDKIDLSALLKANFVAGTSQVSDFVQVVQTGNDITVKVDPDGASNGKNFVDVAVLDHAGTPGPDLVRTWFGDAEHTLTA